MNRLTSIGQEIKRRRKSKGILQKDLAAKIGISSNALVSIEKGRSIPSKHNLDLICQELGLHIVIEDDMQTFDISRLKQSFKRLGKAALSVRKATEYFAPIALFYRDLL